MTAPATREHRVFPVLTLPVFDLRVGDVVVGTDSEIIGIDADNPWTRRLTERHPGGQTTHFAYDCADELVVHRRPAPAPAVRAAAEEAGSNTGRLVGIRCPRCGYERAFVVQITLDVVMLDDGVDSAAPGQPAAGHVPSSIRRADSPTATPSSATKVGAAAATAGRSKSSASARALTPRGDPRRAVAPPGVDTLDAWTRTHRR